MKVKTSLCLGFVASIAALSSPAEEFVTISLTGYQSMDPVVTVKGDTTKTTQKIDKFRISTADLVGYIADLHPDLEINTVSSVLNQSKLLINDDGDLVVRQPNADDIYVGDVLTSSTDATAESFTQTEKPDVLKRSSKAYSYMTWHLIGVDMGDPVDPPAEQDGEVFTALYLTGFAVTSESLEQNSNYKFHSVTRAEDAAGWADAGGTVLKGTVKSEEKIRD